MIGVSLCNSTVDPEKMSICHIHFLAYTIILVYMTAIYDGNYHHSKQGTAMYLNSGLSGFKAHDINCYAISFS